MTAASDRLYELLRRPETAATLSGENWNSIIRAGRAERLVGTLAARLGDAEVPDRARAILDEASEDARRNQDRIRFEIERMAEALLPTGMPVVLLKGGAYLMADLPPLPGRQIGDLDILVPEARLREAEAALREAGWRSAKPRGGYDDQYYREYMHELPPLAHEQRGNVVDLHHNILPRTARLSPDAEGMIARSVPLPSGLRVLAPADMLIHAAVHLAYDGDFEGGARNLWDLDRLVRIHLKSDPAFIKMVRDCASGQGLLGPLERALRLARDLYGTPVPPSLSGRADTVDRLALRKLRGRGPYGELGRPVSAFILFARGHWLRMPPLMLARHLTTKWQARRREASVRARRTGR